MKIPHRRILALIPVGILLGYLVVAQLNAARQSNIVRSQDTSLSALEVSSLLDRNQKLRDELGKQIEKKQKLEATKNDRTKSQQQLQDEQTTLTIYASTTSVTGKGVVMVINDHLEREQLVDIKNAIANVGAEAFAINTHRFGPRTSIRNLNLVEPYTFEIIGDPDVLQGSLTRPGGVLNQIRIKGGVSQKTITLSPATD